MKDYYFKLKNLFSRIESKIAFYPSIISLVGLLFAILMYYAESRGISGYLVEHAPILVIDDLETARTILSVFIGGLISIMVFSFSMVMILLNNASSNFSPRVLPGLISNRRHQLILGVFNSTLLYCIFTLVAIEPTGNKYQLPGFSVLLAILGMIFCLGAFIYFIHSISQEIQVNNIMHKIYLNAKDRLQDVLNEELSCTHITFDNTKNFHKVKSERSGYFQDISEAVILEIAEAQDAKIEIIPVKGTYIFKGDELFRINKELDEEEKTNVSDQFVFSNNELVEDNYVLAFKQITEIAVKAMSPGINDPGTAIIAIDYLTELFLLRSQKRNENYFSIDSTPIVKFRSADFNTIMYHVLASLRTYASHDIIIANKLLSMLEILLKSEDIVREEYRIAIVGEIMNLHSEVLERIHNERDKKLFDQKITELKEHLDL